jgi:hypothetical protein
MREHREFQVHHTRNTVDALSASFPSALHQWISSPYKAAPYSRKMFPVHPSQQATAELRVAEPHSVLYHIESVVRPAL